VDGMPLIHLILVPQLPWEGKTMSGKQTCGILLITSPTSTHSGALQEWFNLNSGPFWGVIGRDAKEHGRHPDIPYVRLSDTTLARNLYFSSHGWLLGVIDEMQWMIQDSAQTHRTHIYERASYSPLLAEEGVVYRCYFYTIEKDYNNPIAVSGNHKWVSRDPSGGVVITQRGEKIKKTETTAPPDGMNVTNLVELRFEIIKTLNGLREIKGLGPV